SATGLQGADLSGLLSLGAASTDAGHYTVTWSFAGNNDYLPASGSSTVDIAKVDATLTITPYHGTYDGQAHGLSGTATGVQGEDLSGLLSLDHDLRNAGHEDVIWSFDGNQDYNRAQGTAAVDIDPRPLTVTAAAQVKVYDGTTAASVSLSDDRVAG